MDASLLTLFWEDFELVCYESLGANGLLIKLKLTASHSPPHTRPAAVAVANPPGSFMMSVIAVCVSATCSSIAYG